MNKYPHVPFTHDEILNAINKLIVNAPGRFRGIGLCGAFNWHSEVSPMIRATGGRLGRESPWYWPRDEKGQAQRLVFLAFMLTWKEDK